MTCLDCFGVPNGPASYDRCDICGGDGRSCLDCFAIPFGTAKYDRCDVCGGDSSTCLDCLGVINGPHVYDACDVCGGNGQACADCLGVPNGRAVYDRCDVCDGDSTVCLDCKDVPFGTSQYDVCGVCEGDGSSCSCLTIGGCPIEELDYALLEWSLTASISKLDGTLDVLRGIKEELCAYDVERGALSNDLTNYLDTALEFKQVLSNFAYVSLYWREQVDEFVAKNKLLVSPPRPAPLPTPKP
jgi:hypothetical protein